MKKISLLISLILLTGCSANPSQTKADEVLDTELFNQAISEKNLMGCALLQHSERNEECKNIVNGLLFTEQAVAKMDKKLCDQIELERYKENCETQVNSKLELKNADAKRLSIEQEAADKKNANICDQINDENQKASCKYNILTDLAITKKDPSLCEGIGPEDMIEKCKGLAK